MYKLPAGATPPPPPPETMPKYKECRIVQYDTARAMGPIHRKRQRVDDASGEGSAVLVSLLKDGEAIRALYDAQDQRPTVDYAYALEDDGQQRSARRLLEEHGLDDERDKARRSKRWTVVWAHASTKARPRPTQRVLMQCTCGYKHESRYHPSLLPYTGCLAHVEITIHTATKAVLRIRGHLDHNDDCKTAVTNLPAAQPQTQAGASNQEDTPPPSATSSTAATTLPVDGDDTRSESKVRVDTPMEEVDELASPPPEEPVNRRRQIPVREEAPSPLVSHLAHLRSLLDEMTAHLAQLPADTLSRADDVAAAPILASMDALSSQLRRLSKQA
ncbi:hypothetical protein EXIGLDRAFT_726099 [Exidia glandulosa HHB12029]|uniref:SWIM-type domain-containing protein n=1 Tax=Exidia glandulosa HHB12029 TaxID=1314781 RepID=A0A165DVV0_EXIGL|nr:hypothetical protein EXIGLDRAFT_726099 [Exidia glandulosa HHB12029]